MNEREGERRRKEIYFEDGERKMIVLREREIECVVDEMRMKRERE